MNIGKSKALELIDEKRRQFNDILNNANYNNMYNHEYEEVYYDAESLLGALFSKEESMQFRRNVGPSVIVRGRSDSEKLQDYKKHLQSCIAQLNVYRSKVQKLWGKEIIINWSVVKSKLQSSFMILNKFKTGIILLLILLGLIAGAIDDWQTVYGFINSTFK